MERSDELRAELKMLLEPSQGLLMRLDGQIRWIAQTNTDHKTRAESWVLRAQKGTVEKFLELFGPSELRTDVELVALARNIFENLIWLRLFNADRNHGLLFYRDLLREQLKSQHQAIEKALEEIELFGQLAIEDKVDFGPVIHLVNKENPTEADKRLIGEHIRAQARAVDEKARKTFSLYAAQAKTNGYEWQAHLIRTQAIPVHEERIRTLEAHQSELEPAIAAIESVEMRAKLTAKWNWRTQAASVGMLPHYNFLYSYTSRLLHSTPVSLITPKQLDRSEVELLLDYLCVAVKECYEQIERFTYPGQVEAISIHIGD